MSFEILIHHFFESHRNRFADTLIPSQSDFGYNRVIGPIQDVLIEYFNSISENEGKAYDFLSFLWFGIPDHTLSYIDEQIAKLPVIKKPNFAIDKNKKDGGPIWDKILKVLVNFYHQNSSLLATALDLSFQYIERKPELYDTFYRTLLGSFIFSYEDERYGFYRQSQLVDLLIDNTAPKHPIYRMMFFDLFPSLIETVKMVTGGSYKKDSISFYKYPIPLNKYSKAIRKKIWSHVSKHFVETRIQAEEGIYHYLKPSLETAKEILQFDLKYLLAIIKKHFTPMSFSHSYHVQRLLMKCNRHGITHPSFPQLKEQFYTLDYKVYKLIDLHRLRNREEHEYESLDYEKFEKVKELEIRYKLKYNSLEQFNTFFHSFCNIHSTPHIQLITSNVALDISIHETYLYDKQLAFEILQTIQARHNLTGYLPTRIIRTITNERKEDIETLFNTIVSSDYPVRPDWVRIFCLLIKEEDVTIEHYHQLIKAYQTSPVSMYLDFDMAGKFTKFDKSVHTTFLKIFIEKHNGGVTHTLSSRLFELHLNALAVDVDLLKQAYLIGEKTQTAFDYDGRDFLELLKLDNGFLIDYLNYHTKEQFNLSMREYDQLSVVWQFENTEEIIRKVFAHFATKKFYPIREEFINAFFKNLSAESSERAAKFLKKYLIDSKRNITKVNMILDVFRNSIQQYYLTAIGEFVKANNKIEDFKKLNLLNNYFITSGQTIVGEINATELENILETISKLPQSSKYIKHKAYLREKIAIEHKNAEVERKRNFLKDQW